jgi:hypothetical protein
MALKKKKKGFSATTQVKALARKHIGSVKPTAVIEPKTKDKKATRAERIRSAMGEA